MGLELSPRCERLKRTLFLSFSPLISRSLVTLSSSLSPLHPPPLPSPLPILYGPCTSHYERTCFPLPPYLPLPTAHSLPGLPQITKACIQLILGSWGRTDRERCIATKEREGIEGLRTKRMDEKTMLRLASDRLDGVPASTGVSGEQGSALSAFYAQPVFPAINEEVGVGISSCSERGSARAQASKGGTYSFRGRLPPPDRRRSLASRCLRWEEGQFLHVRAAFGAGEKDAHLSQCLGFLLSRM